MCPVCLMCLARVERWELYVSSVFYVFRGVERWELYVSSVFYVFRGGGAVGAVCVQCVLCV